ncbi:hypothetical protein HDU67_001494, partial [Dinochytrium kinnereticum]
LHYMVDVIKILDRNTIKNIDAFDGSEVVMVNDFDRGNITPVTRGKDRKRNSENAIDKLDLYSLASWLEKQDSASTERVNLLNYGRIKLQMTHYCMNLQHETPGSLQQSILYSEEIMALNAVSRRGRNLRDIGGPMGITNPMSPNPTDEDWGLEGSLD